MSAVQTRVFKACTAKRISNKAHLAFSKMVPQECAFLREGFEAAKKLSMLKEMATALMRIKGCLPTVLRAGLDK